jgi:uncharacterized protein (TIGR02145 family)
VITLSGTPSVAGTFNYSILLTGGCGTVNATGSITVTAFNCGTTTITDINNNSYNTVAIGTQCWTKENLRVTKYRDGTDIPLDGSGGVNGGESGSTWYPITTGARTVYAHSAANLATYGYLYNWFAAIDSNGLCPSGWHVPSDIEWTTLESHVGTNPGTKLKKKDALWSTNTGTDNYGFSGLPGGYRSSGGSFDVVRYNAFFWSATENDVSGAWFRILYNSNGVVHRGNFFTKSVGASVRCLRD